MFAIFVGNLTDSVDENRLREWFTVFGFVHAIRILRDGGGRSKHAAFISMRNESEAWKAIGALDGQPQDGKLLQVTPSHRQQGIALNPSLLVRERRIDPLPG
jgi:RNA recognition motif-containing protein